MIFFFSSRRRHTRWPRDWSQTCALPICFATGYVYLPLLFAGFGVMISRSFVRTMPISFRRADWLVYTVRAFEFSEIGRASCRERGWVWAAAGTVNETSGVV